MHRADGKLDPLHCFKVEPPPPQEPAPGPWAMSTGLAAGVGTHLPAPACSQPCGCCPPSSRPGRPGVQLPACGAHRWDSVSSAFPGMTEDVWGLGGSRGLSCGCPAAAAGPGLLTALGHQRLCVCPGGKAVPCSAEPCSPAVMVTLPSASPLSGTVAGSNVAA